jgi:hypothetical protein
MKLTEKEKDLLKYLLKKELKKFVKEENQELMFEDTPSFAALEKEYEALLKNLLEKIK